MGLRCGRYSGRNSDHRKVWVLERVKELAAVFALDVAAYAVMSNHFICRVIGQHQMMVG